MIKVIWCSYHEDVLARFQWDDTFIGDLMSGDDFEHVETQTGFEGIEVPDFAVVVIHARLHTKDLHQINKDLKKLKSCIVMLVGDEANVFPFEELKHPNMKTHVMHPRPGRHDEADRFMVNSYAPDTKLLKDYKGEYLEKPLDWFFAGQLGHTQRDECVAALEDIPNGKLVETEGFTQGLKHDEYFRLLASAKFAPCPSGPETPDTFRLYEALEAGCIPIVDSLPSRAEYPGGFWENLFGETPPFPILDSWESAKGTIEGLLPNWKEEANKIFSWWQRKKRGYYHELMTDIYHLTGMEPTEKITVMMPCSPIPRHPSTEMITETIESIRSREEPLKQAEILVQLDGVREEQEDRRADYEDYQRKFIWECNWEHERVVPFVFDSHHHQALMAKATINEVKTPYLLYVEQDTPLVDDINIHDCMEALNEFNLVRFSHEAVIPEPHRPMMLDKEPRDGFIRTVQWSGRPHLARTEFYRWVLSMFEWGKKAFIEHKMYGLALNDFNDHGFYGWQKYGMAIYAPEKENLRRSANLNGRQNDAVYESEL